jgi:hypothetical protein
VLQAQQNWGAIQGLVTDLAGSAVPHAYVGLSGDSLPGGLTSSTDDTGAYTFGAVVPGKYTVTVVAPGFRTLRYHNLQARLGTTVTFNARLSLGSVVESIEVNDSLYALETTSAQTATNITASEFDNLARGRSFHTILMMAPGARHEIRSGNTGVGGFQVDGSSGSENAWFIDGVEVSDLMTGALRPQNSLPFEFIREIQVKTGGFEAEFGGATGGVISVATRGGSNEFHGELLLQATQDRWNAGDRGFYQRAPDDSGVAEFLRPREDRYTIFYPGISAGGPILRNQLFFYTSYMPELERTNRAIDYETGRRAWTSTRTRQYGLTRIDATPAQKLQLNAAWVWSPFRRTGALPVRDPRVPAPENDLSALGEYMPSQTVSLAASYAVTPRLLLNFRYGYKYLNAKSGNYGIPDEPFFTYRTPSTSAQGVPEEFAGVAGYQNVGATYRVDRDIMTRNNLYADLSHITHIAGRQHIIKAGYSLNRLYNNIRSGYTQGRFEIYWGDTFSRGSINAERGRYGYYIFEDLRMDAAVAGRNHGAYVQDTWRITPHLTLNAGVRVEKEFLPPYRAEVNGRRVVAPVSFGWGDKLAPRIGAAWDIHGDGRWKLSGSLGIFYDVMKYTLARAAFGGEYWVSYVYRLDNPDLSTLNSRNPGGLGTAITAYDNRSIPINQSGELSGIDPSLKPYTSRELTVSLERRLSSRFEMAVRYTRKDLLRAIEDVGVLDANDNEVYLIANPGFGLTRNEQSPYGQKTPDGREYLVPRAKRQYDALELRAHGQAGSLNVVTSYTYSRLWGNYAGLANSDEAGRSDPSISRSFDLPTYYFDSTGSQRNVYGRLATDRPHVFKIFAWQERSSRFGTTTIGGTQVAMSGGLDSTTVNYLTAPTYPFGRGDMGRMPTFTQTDVSVSHQIRFSERLSMKLEANATNLLNQAAVISRVTHMTRQGNISRQQLPWDAFFNGYNVQDFVHPGSSPAWNPIYGLPGGDPVDGGVMYKGGRSDVTSAFLATNPGFGAYQGPRAIRLGLRFIF